jgi:4-hydroxyacetophenone monooxygenase
MADNFGSMVREAVRDEAALRAALAEADIAPMVMVLAQLSGDRSILDEVAPHIHGAWSFLESVPEELKQKVRDRLVETLQDYAVTGRPPPPRPSTDTLQHLMSAGVGQTVPDEYIPLLMEEMRFGPEDTRAVRWRRDPARLKREDLPVVVVGAGMTGVCLGIRLGEMGIPYTILEKNESIGGTWLENTYPGCAVDTPNHFFSYSFATNNRWTRHFARQPEIRAYIEGTAKRHGVQKHVRFGVEVTDATWDEATARWRVTVRRLSDGVTETLTCRALVSAVGQLNRPSIPDIPGLDGFKGPVFHTARWDHSVPLAGRRVAMIGTGASAMQAGPSIAPEVAHLTVFQRQAHWALSNPNYHKEVAPGQIWALEHIPFFAQWLRFQLFWASSDGFHSTLQIDPKWDKPDVSLNEANHKMREMIVDHIRKELDGDEALLAKVVPPYPPYGKRMLRDNHWYRMLKRPNVTLETGRIARVEPDAIVMQDGTRHAVDVVVLATGFQASRMLWPMEIRGRGGVTIRELWGDDDPRAYLGITVPGFPNLFITYGPNTNLAHGGSIYFHSECQVRYICQALREMVEEGLATVEVRQEVHDAYNHRLDEACQNMVWTHPGVTNWYKNRHNRVTVTSPWRLLDYWKLTQHFVPEEFRVTHAPGETPAVPGQTARAVESATSLPVS